MIDEETLAPTLENLKQNTKLKWVFVGGKGGVGKTTTSSSLAIQLSKVRESVLLVSTDPAHNLSDAFAQQFSKDPTLVNGFPNLYAMEVDPSVEPEETGFFDSLGQDNMSFIKEISQSLPGVDEAMSLTEVLRLIQKMTFSVVVFDTAPTGHALRFLALPEITEKLTTKFLGVGNRFSGLISQFGSMFGMNMNHEEITKKLEQQKRLVEDLITQFKNPELTTFVCVCIPEFLSVYETERLMQELNKFELDVSNIVVNQVLFPNDGSPCGLCQARSKMQKKYLDLIYTLYDQFHIVKMPLLESEVRGVESLTEFSKYLFEEYKPPYPSSSV